MRILTKLFVISLLISSCPIHKLHSQILNWQYENIITDTQQSGASPELVQDNEGNLHLSYWNREQDKLIYGFKVKDSPSWNFQSLFPDINAGFRSAMTVGADGVVHIAFLENIDGQAYLNYARGENQNWQLEPLTINDIGEYGPNVVQPNFNQAAPPIPVHIRLSLDIILLDEGRPFISYFDGSFLNQASNFRDCSLLNGFHTSYFSEYELDLKLLVKDDEANWSSPAELDIPYDHPDLCLDLTSQPVLRRGDRFGEFCRIISMRDSLWIFAPSIHNHNLLAFSCPESDLSNWTSQIIDSVTRFEQIMPKDFRLSFDHIQAEQSGDSILHMAYGVSDLFGLVEQQFTVLASDKRKRSVWYSRIQLDSLGTPSYQPYYHTFKSETEGEYLGYLSMEHRGIDTVYVAYQNTTTNEVRVQYTLDGGSNWIDRFITNSATNTPIQSYQTSDSLYFVFYEGDRDALSQAAAAWSDTSWVLSSVSIQEQSGSSVSSVVNRDSGQDNILVAYKEEFNDALMLASRRNGLWENEVIPTSESNIQNITLSLLTDDRLILAYQSNTEDGLYFAQRDNSIWNFVRVDSSSKPREFALKTINDSLHIAYYDLNTGFLKYVRGSFLENEWDVSFLDDSELFSGQFPSMTSSPEGELHLTYVRSASDVLRYAKRDKNGKWTFSSIVSANNIIPNQSDIALYSTGEAAVAFLDLQNSSIKFARQSANGSWTLEEIENPDTDFLTPPLRLIIDDQDKPWILFNTLQGDRDLRLLRRDDDGVWRNVSVFPNETAIGGGVSFELIEKDFYIIGQQSRQGQRGIGLLFASDGVSVSNQDQLSDTPRIDIFPNPAGDLTKIKIDSRQPSTGRFALYDVHGQSVLPVLSKQLSARSEYIELNTSSLANGVYFLVCNIGDLVLLKKLSILR